MTGLTSSNSTPVPYPKSKSTTSLEENVIAPAGSVNLVNVQLNLSSTSSTSGSSSNLMLGEKSLSGLLPSPYHHLGSGSGTGGSGPCGGFSTQYAWMCDLHGSPYREEVAWVKLFLLPISTLISDGRLSFRSNLFISQRHIVCNKIMDAWLRTLQDLNNYMMDDQATSEIYLPSFIGFSWFVNLLGIRLTT